MFLNNAKWWKTLLLILILLLAGAVAGYAVNEMQDEEGVGEEEELPEEELVPH